MSNPPPNLAAGAGAAAAALRSAGAAAAAAAGGAPGAGAGRESPTSGSGDVAERGTGVIRLTLPTRLPLPPSRESSEAGTSE